MSIRLHKIRLGRSLLTVTAVLALYLTIPKQASADEVVVGHLSVNPVDSLKAATPHRVKLSDKKPAAIKAEPAYRGTPAYGSISLGTSKQSVVLLVLDTFPGDKLPRLYLDLAGNGDLTVTSDFLQLKALSQFAADSGSIKAAVSSGAKSTVPIGAVASTVARYESKGVVQEVKCPVLFTVIGDELDYSIAVQHTGTLTAGGKQYKIALTDVSANAVFDTYTHGDDQGPLVKLLIDINDDGKFDPKREAFDLAKPFRLAGNTYEIAEINPLGTIIALQTTTKRAEGAISPDDLAVGSEIIDFVAKSIEGKTIQFPSGYKHKVVMLDFWATWCGPCVAEVPNVVSVYNQYHAAGFEIVGVSLDRANNLQTVVDFCQQANMTWPQIYDGGYWNAAIAKLFAIQSIPQAFLVDGDTGTILAMGESLRGDGLQAAVTKALTKKGLLGQ